MFSIHYINSCEFEETDHGDRWEIRMVVPKGFLEGGEPAGKLFGVEAYNMQIMYIMATASGLAERCGLSGIEDILKDAAMRIIEATENSRKPEVLS